MHEVGSPYYIDARCHDLYEMNEVTGLDFEVQGVLITQKNTATVLQEACEMIERGLDEFSFMCHGGTHRSVI